jgi:hypothetical protein
VNALILTPLTALVGSFVNLGGVVGDRLGGCHGGFRRMRHRPGRSRRTGPAGRPGAAAVTAV